MKTWFITGASRGLGFEVARAALEAGDQVVATARNIQQLKDTFKETGPRLLAVNLDVTESYSIQTAVDQAILQYGRIDVLVNNAGYGQLGAFEENSIKAIERQFATNLFGVFAVTRAILPIMRAQRSGHIVTTSSIAGIIGFDGASIYCATKFALEGWSESLSIELARFGINTTIIEPGYFRTDFLDQSSVSYGDIYVADYATSSDEKKQALNAMNHNQVGDPQKFGKAIVELAASERPPIRIAAGSGAYATVLNKAEALRTEAEAWHQWSVSTDITS
ncbi:SDR family NAD(P)-dependent oxidoreductase [Burkholderia pseudomallei]|nr:SDR family NAD(P)-dependent oxidoreductase [Burkholderia pseudomallei]